MAEARRPSLFNGDTRRYIMSYERLFELFSHPAAAVAAVLLLIGATVWLEIQNPKKQIKERFDARFCGQNKDTPLKGDGVVPNPYFSTDSATGFGPKKLYAMLDAYSQQDKEDHLRFIRYDFAYPFAYAIPFAVLILWLQRGLSPPPPARVWWLFLIPLAALLFDLFENAGMRYILKAGSSNKPDGAVYFTAAANVLKWVCVWVSVVLIFSGLVGVLLRAAYKFRPGG